MTEIRYFADEDGYGVPTLWTGPADHPIHVLSRCNIVPEYRDAMWPLLVKALVYGDDPQPHPTCATGMHYYGTDGLCQYCSHDSADSEPEKCLGCGTELSQEHWQGECVGRVVPAPAR